MDLLKMMGVGTAHAPKAKASNVPPASKNAPGRVLGASAMEGEALLPAGSVSIQSPYDPTYNVKRDRYINDNTRALTPDVIHSVMAYKPPSKQWMEDKIAKMAKMTKLSPEIIRATLWQESHLGTDPKQYSGPAIGPFQIEPETNSSMIDSMGGTSNPQDRRAYLYNPDNNYKVMEALVNQRMKSTGSVGNLWSGYNTGAYKKYLNNGKFTTGGM